MQKLDANLLAGLTIISATFLLIATMYFTSFERHHTHDRPHQERHSHQIASPESDVMTGPLVESEGSGAEGQPQETKYYPSYTNSESLEHYNHKAQIFIATFTFLGLVIAAFGLYLISRTLVETRKAAISAEKALEQTRVATTATTQAVQNTRAWVAVLDTPHSIVDEFTSIHSDGRKEIFKNAITFTVRVKNVGGSPARNLKMQIKNLVLPFDDEIPTFNTEMDYAKRAVFLPQGSNHKNGRVDFFGKFSEQLWRETHVAYVFLRCEYQTVFDDEIRFTRELFKFHPVGRHTVGGVELPKFSVSQVGTQNCNT